MKFTSCALLLAVGLVMSGCGKKEPAPPAPTVVNDSSAPASGGGGYVGAMMKAEQSAIKTVDLTSLNQAVQLFNAQEGRNPKDLDELVSAHYIGQIPAAPAGKKLVYDASQGKISLAPQ